MTQIFSEDYANKRIYLHPDTVSLGVDFAALQREHRARRRLNANEERKYAPMVTFRGNEAKGGGKFTPYETNLAQGVRIVPYDAHHNLKIKNEVLCTDDQISNQACFDRLTVLSNIDIDIDFSPTEIVTVSVGSAVTEEDKTDIAALVNTNTNNKIAEVRQDISNLNDFDPSVDNITTVNAATDTILLLLQTLLKYHDNYTVFYGADGTTEVTQQDAYFISVYDNDLTTEIKRVGFRNSSNTPVKITEATRLVLI